MSAKLLNAILTFLLFAHSMPAMSNPRPACGPFEDFARPSLGFHWSKTILPTDNLSLFW